MRRTPPSFQPGPLTRAQAEALNQLARDLYNSLLDHFTAVPPLECQQDAGGVRYRLGVAAAAGSTLSVGEVDGSPLVTADTILFNQANGLSVSTPSAGVAQVNFTGAGIEVKAGLLDYTGVTVLIFDPADGFVLNQPSAGQVEIAIADATASQAGIVNTTAQTFGGAKTFVNAGSTTILNGNSIQVDNGTDVCLYQVTNDGSGQSVNTVSAGIGPKTSLKVLAYGGTFTNGGCNLTSGAAGTPQYAVNGTKGVSGTGGGSDTITGGIVTALGAAGSTGTVTLAKVTVGGANGSLTFSNGRITGFVAPT